MQAYSVTGKKIVAATETFNRSKNRGLSNNAKIKVETYRAINRIAPRRARTRFIFFIWINPPLDSIVCQISANGRFLNIISEFAENFNWKIKRA